MYAITNDYFDSFSAIFGPRECLLNGKWYPLGHFATEALEMDRRLLRDLEKAIADFKPELEVFLAARTASSAAVAQRKLDAAWAVLAQLPAYNNFALCSHGSEGLFRSMREHPDRTDDSVTEGTNFHRAMTYWLDRLERLPDAVDDFIRNTSLMLGDYFEDLPARSPAAYAEAYEKYRRMMKTAFQYAEEEDEMDEDLESIELDFPVRLGFRAMAAGNVPRRCHNCRHFFLTVGGHDTVYCNRIAPDETKRTCRQVGAHRKEKYKNEMPIHKEYSKAYNRLKGRKNRGSISTDEWNRLVATIQDWRDAALRGEMSDAEFKQRLDGI